MKILIIVLLFFSTSLFAAKNNLHSNQDTIDFDRNSIYYEFNGNTFFMGSANYEYIFSKSNFFNILNASSFSLRIGFGGGYMVNGGYIFMYNWQLGYTHRLEIGAGFLYVLGNPEDSWHETGLWHTKDKILSTFTIGYVYYPESNKWVLRAGFTPIYSFDGKQQGSIGFSVGWHF